MVWDLSECIRRYLGTFSSRVVGERIDFDVFMGGSSSFGGVVFELKGVAGGEELAQEGGLLQGKLSPEHHATP